MTPPRCSYPKPKSRTPKLRKEIPRHSRPARESEKAKARRLAGERRPRTAIPTVNRERKAKNLERAHGPAERRAWTKVQPCYICGRTPSDAAHMRSGGTSRKSDVEHTAPLCSNDVASGYVGHHDEFDAGKQSFAAKYAFDRDEAAARCESEWQAHLAAVEGARG